MYWEIGRYIGSVLLGGERSEYGKKILATLSQELTSRYGSGFEYAKITRMIKFAEVLSLETEQARLYYANDVATRHLGVRDLRRQISRKAYERREIANTQICSIIL